MSKEEDMDFVEAEIKRQWPGYRLISARGLVHVPEVRDGGLTDELIRLAVGIAHEYYTFEPNE